MSFSAGSACLHLAHRITQLELQILQSATKSWFKRVSRKLFEEHSLLNPQLLRVYSSTRDLMLFDVVWRVMRSTNTIYIHLPSSEQSSSRETLNSEETIHFNFIQLHEFKRMNLDTNPATSNIAMHCQGTLLTEQLAMRKSGASASACVKWTSCGVSNESEPKKWN